jgi:hypothetical protein
VTEKLGYFDEETKNQSLSWSVLISEMEIMIQRFPEISKQTPSLY